MTPRPKAERDRAREDLLLAIDELEDKADTSALALAVDSTYSQVHSGVPSTRAPSTRYAVRANAPDTVTPMETETRLIADDLFAGAGGWDVAADWLDIHARGIENMKEARATRDAAGLTTVHDDVWTFKPRYIGPEMTATGLIASPPCQTFSQAGKGSVVGRGVTQRDGAALTAHTATRASTAATVTAPGELRRMARAKLVRSYLDRTTYLTTWVRAESASIALADAEDLADIARQQWAWEWADLEEQPGG